MGGSSEKDQEHRSQFLPGVNPLASGIAGAFRTPLKKFILYAGAGALAWAGAWIRLGYLCSGLIEAILAAVARMGTLLIIAVVSVVVLLAVVRYVRRRLFMRHLLRARIESLDLKQRMDRGENVLVVDFRTVLDIQAAPLGISGARWPISTFVALVNRGTILREGNEKMSKARGGVVNPEPIVRGHAAGAHRLHEVFVGPIEAAKPWRCSRSG